MRTRLNLKPGKRGTKQLLAQYGDRLICVRYRYDARRKKRLKTVELVVSERDWEPRRPRSGRGQTVSVRIAFAETAIREQVKKAGGTWDPERKLWNIPHALAIALGLAPRIVHDPASTGRCHEDFGIADEMKSKTMLAASGSASGVLVANGEAEVAVDLFPLLISVPGIELVGPLPGDLQDIIVVAAAVMAGAKDADASKALINFLRTPEAAAVIKAKGMEPAAP